jgi:hypothetical protein
VDVEHLIVRQQRLLDQRAERAHDQGIGRRRPRRGGTV